MRLMKIKEVMHVTTLARATADRQMELGRFQKLISLGGIAMILVADAVEN